MKVFITGATGFLGSAVTKQCLSLGFEVRAIRRSSSSMDLLEGAADRVDWLTGDVLDYDSIAAGMDGAQAVVHSAAFLGFDGKKSISKMTEINVGGTANVINAALETSGIRLLHVSSIAALGRHDQQSGEIDETAVWKPSKLNTYYAVTKHEAEMEVHRGIAEGLDAVMVNPSLIMGPGRKGENTMQIAEKLLSRSLPGIPTGGTNVVDVEDVAAGIMAALEKGRIGERYILAGQNLTWKQLLTDLAAELGVAPPPRVIKPRTMRFIASLSELGGFLTQSPPLLTRETARLSSSLSYYNNQKAVSELGCSFRPFSETASRIAAAVLPQ